MSRFCYRANLIFGRRCCDLMAAILDLAGISKHPVNGTRNATIFSRNYSQFQCILLKCVLGYICTKYPVISVSDTPLKPNNTWWSAYTLEKTSALQRHLCTALVDGLSI